MAQSEDTEPSSMKENSEKPIIVTAVTLLNDTNEISEINDSEVVVNRNESMIEDETMPSLISITSFSSGVISSKQEESQISRENEYQEDDDEIQALHQNDNYKEVKNANGDSGLKMSPTYKRLTPPSVTITPVPSLSALPVLKPILSSSEQKRQGQLRKSVPLNHNLNSNNEETECVDVTSDSESDTESRGYSDNGCGFDDDNNDDYDDDDDYNDEDKRPEIYFDEKHNQSIEENRSDDTDVDDSYKYDQTSHDGSVRASSLEPLVNVKERSKSLQNLSYLEEEQSNGNKRKFAIYQRDITRDGKEKQQVDPLLIGLNNHNEDYYEIQSDYDINIKTKKYKQDTEKEQNDKQLESNELTIYSDLQNNHHKNDINVKPSINNKITGQQNNTLEKETDGDIIIEDQSSVENGALSISTTIPYQVNKNSQIFITEAATHQQYMQGNINTVVTSTTKNYTNNTNNAREIEEVLMETDDITPQSQLPMEFKIDNVVSLGLQTIDNEKTVSSDDYSILKSQVEQLKQENEELKQSLINIENDHEKCLVDLTQKYTTEMDQNKQLTNELNKLKKLLVQTEKNNAVVSNEKTTMTDIFLETQYSSGIVENPQNSTPSSNQTAESPVSMSLGSTEQWPSRNNCGSPIISLKYPNVDGILNSADNSFVASDPSKTMNKSLSNAFFTSSRILETLASITQGRADPNILNAERKNSNRNSIRNTNSADISHDKTGITSRLQGNSRGQFNEATSPLVSNRPDEKFISRKRKAQSLETYEYDHSIGDGDVDHTINEHERQSKTKQKEGTTSEEIIVGDGIKCFVYQDDDDSEERSFLIQAEEPLQIANSKGVVRECGPFLLKNIEVRMSEINGTINIWGKEIKMNSSAQGIDENDGDLEKNIGEEEDYNGYTLELNNEERIWRKPSCTGISSAILRSTNEKNIPPMARTSPTPTIQRRRSRDLSDQLHCNRHHQSRNSIMNNFGSMPNLDCHASPYAHQQQQRVYPQMCESIINSHPKFLCQDCKINNIRVGCLCDNGTDNIMTKNVSCDDFNQTKHAYDSSPRHRSSNLPYTCPTNHHHRASHVESSFLDDNNPLIRSQQSSPLSDSKRRHLRGKRVRGILMDFLKSCGPCRNPHTTTQDDQQYQKAEAMLAPDIHITSAANSVIGANKRSKNHTNVPTFHRKECCNNSHTKRIDIADLEKQIQIFQDDMEKMQSRSNVFLNMLHVLHGIDSS